MAVVVGYVVGLMMIYKSYNFILCLLPRTVSFECIYIIVVRRSNFWIQVVLARNKYDTEIRLHLFSQKYNASKLSISDKLNSFIYDSNIFDFQFILNIIIT